MENDSFRTNEKMHTEAKCGLSSVFMQSISDNSARSANKGAHTAALPSTSLASGAVQNCDTGVRHREAANICLCF